MCESKLHLPDYLIKLIGFVSAKPNCDVCNKLEEHLANLYDDFVKHINALTVKIENSHLSRLYSPTKEPAVVFFRHGVPLLYDGMYCK